MTPSVFSLKIEKIQTTLFKVSRSETKQNLPPLSTFKIKQNVGSRKIKRNYEVHAYLIQIMILFLPFFRYTSLANCFIFICIVWDLCFMRRLKMNFDLIECKKFKQFFQNAGNHAEQEGGYTCRVYKECSHKEQQGMCQHGCSGCTNMQIFGKSQFALSFSTIENRELFGPELSSIEQTAPADPNS